MFSVLLYCNTPSVLELQKNVTASFRESIYSIVAYQVTGNCYPSSMVFCEICLQASLNLILIELYVQC